MNVVAFCAHPDDIEIGMGGTVGEAVEAVKSPDVPSTPRKARPVS